MFFHLGVQPKSHAKQINPITWVLLENIDGTPDIYLYKRNFILCLFGTHYFIWYLSLFE